MAEYIDRKQLLELINEDCKYKNPTNEYTRGCNEVCDWAIKTIKNIPTADVVPKSEVERWRRNLEERAEEKAEVAREIFEEIEKMLSANTSGELRCDSIEWFDYYDLHLAEDIAELKKKYTESENG